MQISTIVVPDAAATPVNHTFSPQRIDGTSALFLEQSFGSSVGYWPLVVSLDPPKAGQTSKQYKFKLTLGIPVVVNETINGVSSPKLAYTLRANLDMVLPEGCTLQNRKDLRKIIVGILGDAKVVDMIENQGNLY